MGQTTSRSAMRQKITAWRRFLMIFALAAFLSGCSDPSHPAAKKVLSEIGQKIAAKGKLHLSELGEPFDQICVFRQDDSDVGYTRMDMEKLLSKQHAALLTEGKDIPANPQNIILFIKGNKAIAAYDSSVSYSGARSSLLYDGYEEKYSLCRDWGTSVIVNNGKFLELR